MAKFYLISTSAAIENGRRADGSPHHPNLPGGRMAVLYDRIGRRRMFLTRDDAISAAKQWLQTANPPFRIEDVAIIECDVLGTVVPRETPFRFIPARKGRRK